MLPQHQLFSQNVECGGSEICVSWLDQLMSFCLTRTLAVVRAEDLQSLISIRVTGATCPVAESPLLPFKVQTITIVNPLYGLIIRIVDRDSSVVTCVLVEN